MEANELDGICEVNSQDDVRTALRDVQREVQNLARFQQGFSELLHSFAESSSGLHALSQQASGDCRPSETLRWLHSEVVGLEEERTWLREQLDERAQWQARPSSEANAMQPHDVLAPVNFQKSFLEDAMHQAPRVGGPARLKAAPTSPPTKIHITEAKKKKQNVDGSAEEGSPSLRKRASFTGIIAAAPKIPVKLKSLFVKRAPSLGSGEEKGRAKRETRTLSAVSVFELKEKMKKSMLKPSLTEDRHYYKTGIWQNIARRQWFENATFLVIAINALWIWVDTDLNTAPVLLEAHWSFQLMENLFCFFFSLEWIVRFMAFKKKRKCLGEAWFMFDSVLVLTMFLETWVLTAVLLIFSAGGGENPLAGNTAILRMGRLLRLTRMGRMARLIRAVPELAILIKGMIASIRSVATTLWLLALIMYIFGVGFKQLTVDTDIHKAPSSQYVDWSYVHTAMYSLWLYGVLCLDYSQEIAGDLLEVNPALFIAYYVFVFLALFTVMNMLIGVLCEVVTTVAATEKEALLQNYATSKLRSILTALDLNKKDYLSKQEFCQLLENQEACLLLSDLGIDVIGLVDFQDVIFEQDPDNLHMEPELSFGELLELVMQLRGSNHATVKDIMELRKLVNAVARRLERTQEKKLTMTSDGQNSYEGASCDEKLASEVTFEDVLIAEEVESVKDREARPKRDLTMNGETNKDVAVETLSPADSGSVGSETHMGIIFRGREHFHGEDVTHSNCELLANGRDRNGLDGDRVLVTPHKDKLQRSPSTKSTDGISRYEM